MRVAFITRSTLYKVPGGDTEQITQTARCLGHLGVNADIYLTSEQINYSEYDLLHFSNIIRPSDILYHTQKTDKPFVVSPNLVDYSEYDQHHRGGLLGYILRFFSAGTNEYLKTIFRWLRGNDILKTRSYITKGHTRSVQEILEKTSLVLPASRAEQDFLKSTYAVDRPFSIIPNGIDADVFRNSETIKNSHLIICAARIEGIKNQLNLIKALNNSPYTLLIVGEAAPNQGKYYKKCRSIAGPNIVFTGRLSHVELAKLYRKAKVHVLPSWFETCGLSTLEAAAMGCNVVITDRGYAKEYFGNDAYYCDPSDPLSIRNAIGEAAGHSTSNEFQKRILNNYTWQRAASLTAEAYKKIIPV